MPAPLTLPPDVTKENGRWLRICPSCFSTVSHLRRNYCVNSSLQKQPCKKCSNISNNPSGMVGKVRVAWYNSFYKSALSRGYTWEITINNVDKLYKQQNGKCKLTGWDIEWSDHGWNHTASIDRIDSSLGYTLQNIQLVHKQVNMAKGTLAMDEFISMCKSVSNNIKENYKEDN